MLTALAVEADALSAQEGDRSERGVLDSPTPNLPVPCWSPDQQAGQVDLGLRPDNYLVYLI